MESTKLDRLKKWANTSHKRSKYRNNSILNFHLELLDNMRFQIGQLLIDGNIDAARQMAERSEEILESDSIINSKTSKENNLTNPSFQTTSDKVKSHSPRTAYKQIFLVCGNWPKVVSPDDSLCLKYSNETPSQIHDIWAERNTIRMQYV